MNKPAETGRLLAAPAGKLFSNFLLAGLLFGTLADLLLWADGPAASGFAVWVVLFAVFINLQAGWDRTANPRHLLFWSGIAVGAAIMTMLRGHPMVIFFSWLLLVTSAAMITAQRITPTLEIWRLRDVVMAYLMTGLSLLYTAVPEILRTRPQSSVSGEHLQGLWRGLLILLPLAAVFTLLFSQADRVFERSVNELFHWASDDLLFHLLRLLLFIWVSTGLLYTLNRNRSFSMLNTAGNRNLGSMEITVILGGLSLLFGCFVLIQLNYLFGGSDTIISTSGLTLSEYARRGFFELLAVTALTLTTLLVLSGKTREHRMFARLSAFLLCCVIMILASAAQRLLLYTDRFGLTMDRLTAAVMMGWLLVVLLLFWATVLKNRPAWFLYSSISSGALILLLFMLANPAGLITRINIQRSLDTAQNLDTAYLAALGTDAVPVLISKLDGLPEIRQCQISRSLLSNYREPIATAKDWRRFNYSRRHAKQLLSENQQRILQAIPEALRDLPGIPEFFTRPYIVGCVKLVGRSVFHFGPFTLPPPSNQAQ